MNAGSVQAGVKAPLWTKDFVMLALANLFLIFSFQMLIPTLPLFVTELGGDELAVGLVISVFTISAMMVRPFAGKALDTVGRRKVLVFGSLIFIACVVGYYWLATVALVLALRFVHGIGWGTVTTSYGTVVSDLIPPERRGEGMGYFGLSGNLAMMLAPVLGIWLVNEYGFFVMFAVSSVLAVGSLLLSQGVRYEQPSRAVETAGTPGRAKPSFWAGLVEGKALFPSLLLMLIGVTYGGVISFITLFGQEAGIANVGWFFLANAAMMLIVRPLSGLLFDRIGHRLVLLPGAFFTIAGLVLLSYSTSEAGLVLAAVFYGIGFGAIQPSLMAWTINRVEPHRRGAANGTLFSAFDLGLAIGAMLLGMVAKMSSYAEMYRVSVLMMVLFLVIYLYYLVAGKEKASV